MPLKLDCPRCKRSLAIPAKRAGTYVICPQCQGRFWVPEETGKDATGGAGPQIALPPTHSATPSSTVPATIPAPSAGNGAGAMRQLPAAPAAPLAPLPAGQPRKVARFIAAEAAESTLKLADDGKLPDLHLREPGDAAKESGPKGMNPLMLYGLLGLSVVASLVLLMVPTEPAEATLGRVKDQARQVLETEYFADMDRVPRQPYQVLLREAQAAHSRGDGKRERELYRQVLEMVRAERRRFDRGLTGSPARDGRLEQQITILLRD